MQNLQPVNPETASPKTRELFGTIEKRLGRIPSMIRTLGQSPAILDAYLHFNEAFADTKTTPRLRTVISAVVSSLNGCEYTLATAFAFGRREGLSEAELRAAQKAESSDPQIAAALRFASSLVLKRGAVERAEVEQLKAAGWDDQEIVEIVALTSLNIFRNYFNRVAATELDFPAPPRQQ